MRLIDADALSSHKFLSPAYMARANSKTLTAMYQQGWNDAIDAIVDNEPTVITNSVYEAYCALSDEEFEHSDSFWITTPKGKKINFVKERPHGEWIDHSEDEGYLECPICGYLTNCEGNKEELHYCWNCGAYMRGGRE